MFKIRCVATTGFDRAIVAMRREHGGREVSDSAWDCFNGMFDQVIQEFYVGSEDRAECSRLIENGDRDFLKFVGLWAHIEAPAQWWAVYGGYFIAQSDVVKKGDMLTRSVFTTYGHLRNLIEVARKTGKAWEGLGKTWEGLGKTLGDLPESWMILEGLEA